MDINGFHNLTRGAESYMDDAANEIIEKGYRYVVTYEGDKINDMIEWLLTGGVDFTDMLGVFGFRTREDMERFESHVTLVH